MARLFAALILLVLLFIFILQNLQQVSLHFLFWQFNGSLALILVLTFIVTIIIVILLVLPTTFKRWISKIQRRNKADLEDKKLN